MIPLSVYLASAAVGMATYLFIRWFKDPLRKIPGPTAIPLFSNALEFGDGKMHVQLHNLYKQYGPVYKINVHQRPVIVVNSSEAIYEALVHQGTDFVGRAVTPRAHAVLRKDIIASNYTDPAYQPLRKTFTKGLRAYGEGQTRLESIIQDTTLDVIESMAAKHGETFDPYNMVFGFVCCIASTILLDDKYTAEDETSKAIHTLNLEILKSLDPGTSSSLLDLFPVLYNIPGLFNDAHQTIRDVRELHEEHVFKRIEEARENFDVNNLRGVLDQFLLSQRQELRQKGSTYITDEGIAGLVIDIIFAGVSTTLGTLCHCLFELVQHQDIQKRLQTEIDENFTRTDVIGRMDRENLPQLEAFFHEIGRHLSLGPIWRRLTLRDTQVGGYQIPEDTRVWMNNFSASHDDLVFEEPFKFNIDRYLEKNGDIVKPDHEMRKNTLSFALGHRKCPGQSVAQTEMFIFIANLLLNFNMEPVGELPSDDPRTFVLETGITPPRFNMRMVPRHQAKV